MDPNHLLVILVHVTTFCTWVLQGHRISETLHEAETWIILFSA